MSSVMKQDCPRTSTATFPTVIAAVSQTRKLRAHTISAIPRRIAIEQAHRRCVAYGLAESAEPDFSPIGQSALSLLIEQNQVLRSHALAVMETLYEQIIDTHNLVILADAKGVILHAVGDDNFLEKSERAALQPGVVWSEKSKGTNAIGTAIFDQVPTQVHASEHYLHANRFLTSSAAPIFDYEGNVVGVLDVAGDPHSFHKHTMALVRMSAQMIENQLFSTAFPNVSTLHFNTRPEFIGTLREGVASFTPGGRILSANRVALSQLGMPLSALQSHTFSSLFGIPMSALHEHDRATALDFLKLCLPSGVRVYGRVHLRLAGGAFQHVSITSGARDCPAAAAIGPATEFNRNQTAQDARRLSGLRYLNTGDLQVATVIDKVNRVLGRDIPILITGETGTGKELLAQAIHNDSPRAVGPFVAVNCASIPETLIESELFGYEDGAFTGARKKGGVGKILQANGGTLFLDEIGDMPLSLQARLLRVLQERTVTPLGSTKSIPVTVELICATNRNLRELIATGGFREDLYYRLNGLVVKLPPLRERTDLEIVAKKILTAESPDTHYALSPEIMKLFKLHSWPGNFRQLTNLLRTAIVMADTEHEIGMQHMPDDFLDDIEISQVQSPTNATDNLVSIGANLVEVEMSMILKSLESHGGNVSATARALGVSRNTIYRKVPQQSVARYHVNDCGKVLS